MIYAQLSPQGLWGTEAKPSQGGSESEQGLNTYTARVPLCPTSPVGPEKSTLWDAKSALSIPISLALLLRSLFHLYHMPSLFLPPTCGDSSSADSANT